MLQLAETINLISHIMVMTITTATINMFQRSSILVFAVLCGVMMVTMMAMMMMMMMMVVVVVISMIVNYHHTLASPCPDCFVFRSIAASTFPSVNFDPALSQPAVSYRFSVGFVLDK